MQTLMKLLKQLNQSSSGNKAEDGKIKYKGNHNFLVAQSIDTLQKMRLKVILQSNIGCKETTIDCAKVIVVFTITFTPTKQNEKYQVKLAQSECIEHTTELGKKKGSYCKMKKQKKQQRKKYKA